MDINLHDQPADSSSGTSSRAQGGASTNGAGHHASGASGTTINGNGGPQIVIHNIHQMNYIQKTENVTNNYYASASQYSQESAVDNET